jgi:hypothetical protein
MSESTYIALMSNVVTVLIATGGWLFTYIVYSKDRKTSQLEKLVAKLKKEVSARISQENIACKMISQLNSMSPRTIKIQIRDRVEEETDSRPIMTEADLR